MKIPGIVIPGMKIPGAAAALLFCLCFVLAAPLQAEGEKGNGTDKKEGEPAEKEDRYLLLTGGDVHTVTGPVLRNTAVLVKNNVIAGLGRDLEIPEGAEILDVAGMRVYPGLIAVSSSGIVGREPPENSTDVFGLGMILGLSGGLTTVVTGNTAAKLTYGTLEDMVVKRKIFTTLRYERRYPQRRADLVRDLEKVRQYIRDLSAWEMKKSMGDKEAEEPDKKWIKGKYDTYLKLLRREITALIEADNMQDLIDASGLAGGFGFRLVIRGGGEGWTTAPELGRKGVSLIITPRRKRWSRMQKNPGDVGEVCGCEVDEHEENEECLGFFEKLSSMECEDEEETAETIARDSSRLLRPSGWSIENARILYESGVPFAIIPGSNRIGLWGLTGRDLLMMPMEAAFAVRGGLPDKAAVEAITINAARILGIDHRVGTIEVGKDADLVVCDGDLLHYKTMVQWVVVNGRVAYDKEKESLFAHIRPRGKAGTEPKPEFWPRELGPMPGFEPDVLPPEPGEEEDAPRDEEEPIEEESTGSAKQEGEK